jgi:adenylate cyclase
VSGHTTGETTVPRTKFATIEDAWRAYLNGTHPNLLMGRRTFGLLPSNPRCKLCSAPFSGPGGFVLRRFSKDFGPWEKFPKVCRRCLTGMNTMDVSGAEVETSFLFADVRASSELARRLGTMDFTHLMQRFYAVATGILFDHDALLDKFVGDEVVGFFLPVMAGPGHAGRAVEAAEALFRAAGYGTTEGPWSLSVGECTPGPRSSGSCREACRASSPLSATRSTSRPTWRPRRVPVRS